MGHPRQFDGNFAQQVFQLHVDQFQMEHALQYVDQRATDLGWIAAAPERGKSHHADQVVDATLQALDLFAGMFLLRVHFYARRSRSSRKNSSGGT